MVEHLAVVNVPKEVTEEISDLLREYVEHAGDFRGVVLLAFSDDQDLHVRTAGNVSNLEIIGACDFAKMHLYTVISDPDGG